MTCFSRTALFYTEIEIARQRRVCTVTGARGTPTLFVDGDIVQGERGIDELSIVEEILELDETADCSRFGRRVREKLPR